MPVCCYYGEGQHSLAAEAVQAGATGGKTQIRSASFKKHVLQMPRVAARSAQTVSTVLRSSPPCPTCRPGAAPSLHLWLHTASPDQATQTHEHRLSAVAVVARESTREGISCKENSPRSLQPARPVIGKQAMQSHQFCEQGW